MTFTYSAYKLNLDGSLSHRENLGQAELDDWMDRVYGKFGSVQVVRDQTGMTVTYTDNGQAWEMIAGPQSVVA